MKKSKKQDLENYDFEIDINSLEDLRKQFSDETQIEQKQENRVVALSMAIQILGTQPIVRIDVEDVLDTAQQLFDFITKDNKPK